MRILDSTSLYMFKDSYAPLSSCEGCEALRITYCDYNLYVDLMIGFDFTP